MNRQRMSVVSCAAALVAGAAAAQGVPEGYTLVELPDVNFDQFDYAEAVAINNRGTVLGRFLGQSIVPIVWEDPANPFLPDTDDFQSGEVYDINDKGVIFYAQLLGSRRNFVKAPGQPRRQLPFFDDPNISVGTSLTAAGEVPAVRDLGINPDDTADHEVFLLRPQSGGGFTEVPIETQVVDPFFESPPENPATSPGGVIVADGGLVGSMYIYDGMGLLPSGLSLPVEDQYFVHDVNDASQVVATYLNGAGQVRGVFVGPDTGGFIVIPGIDVSDPFGTTEASPEAVNASGVVVGDAVNESLGAGEPREAFIWSQETGTIALRSLVVDGSANGWTLETAVDINDSGWVAGNGINPMGQRSAYLLIPRGPCTADTNRDGLVMPSDFNAWIIAYNNGCDG